MSEDCRKTVCLLYMKKATRELTEFPAERIKKIYANFVFQDIRGICQVCRTTLYRMNEGKDVELPSLFNFSTITIKMATQDEDCHCLICKIGNLKLKKLEDEKSSLEA